MASITARTRTPKQSATYVCQQCRHATLLRRPKRPYTFTQLVTLSDGSTYTHRTTSPAPVFKSSRDTRNSPLWNPSSQKLMNMEEDAAGRLKAFRNKFGRGWDAETVNEEKGEEVRDGEEAVAEGEESLLDLITGYGQDAESQTTAKRSRAMTGSSERKGRTAKSDQDGSC
ncbi:MAG: hypothetical protein MMC33_005177 [Icmadophila ericetorum]|nr:hypothetical protein [Icmadophila ericetorum]